MTADPRTLLRRLDDVLGVDPRQLMRAVRALDDGEPLDRFPVAVRALAARLVAWRQEAEAADDGSAWATANSR